jgi:hypothetical protein
MEMNLLALEKLSTLELETLINDLIKEDFSKLVQLLYRIDVSEAKLKNVLKEHPNEDAGKLMAKIVIERLAATKKARESFSTKSTNIEDDEERL